MNQRKFKLTIELVPSSIWFSSLNKLYKNNDRLDDWWKLKEELFEREGKQCWICNKKRGVLQAHEFWEYDDKNHIQKLVAIHHLCGKCHKIKHIGFWCQTEDGRKQLSKEDLSRNDLINHFCKVNNCSQNDFENHKEKAFEIWRKRSHHKWKQDFGKFDPTIQR